MSGFESLIVWQKSANFIVDVYTIFQNSTDFGFKNQIQRAAMSIANNIAEGSERRTDREYKRFLNIAQGSASEVKSMLLIAFRLGYVDELTKVCLIEKLDEIGKLIDGLNRYLSSQII